MNPTARHGRTASPAPSPLGWLLCALLLFAPVPGAAAASAVEAAASATALQVDLDLQLDPASRQLTGLATWTVPAGMPLELQLDRRFVLESVTVDGARLASASTISRDGSRQVFAIPPHAAKSQRWTLRWRGELLPLDRSLDHRSVIAALPAMASAEGSYLPAGSGWYPEARLPVRYRVSIEVPAGQRAVVPGRLVRESETGGRQRAEFESTLAVEGITLMAGPYRVDERLLRLGARNIRLRTWFVEALQALAPGYLDAAAAYIERFDRQIGPFAFDGFSIVSSPLPTGFGLPGATYIGENVLPLPFMRGQSLAHEILHNWWGNGVRVDWERGNWSEGLTTYLADHALRAEQSPAAAREMRWGWLRDFAAIDPERDAPLAQFTARTHGAAAAVGYGKSAMLFHMVRGEIGDAAFDQALRDLWKTHAGRSAGWRDLQLAFERRAGRPLGGLFGPMLGRTGAPTLMPRTIQASNDGRSLRIAWSETPPVAMALPAIAWYGERPVRIRINLQQGERRTIVALPGSLPGALPGALPDTLQIDPGFEVWRTLRPAESPPLLRDVMLAPDTRVHLATQGDGDWRMAALALAGRMLEARPLLPASSDDLRSARPVLVIGLHADVEALAQAGTPLARMPELSDPARLPDAALWAVQDRNGGKRLFISVEHLAALIDLQRRAPHYGAQGFVGFRSGTAFTRGIGNIEVARIAVERPAAR